MFRAIGGVTATLVITAAALMPTPSSAKCAPPSPFVLPRDGSVLPVNPTLYVFIPMGWDERNRLENVVDVVDGEQKPVTTQVVRLSGGPDYVVLRVVVTAKDGVRLAMNFPAHAKYTVESRALQPVTVFEVERAKEKNFAWTCSYKSTRDVVPSLDAPAYRVEWAESEAALGKKPHDPVIVPGRNLYHFWRANDPVPPLRIELGHLNCGGVTFPWDGKAVVVRLVALREDGTSIAAAKLIRLEPPPSERELRHAHLAE